MKKTFTRFLAAVALLVFMTPSLVTWGQSRTSTTETITINSYASTNSWTNGTTYSTINTSHITISGLTNGNNSKYYSSNESWRHYENDGGTVTVAISSSYTSDYTLSSVKFIYSAGNSGILKDGTTTVSSGSAYSVSGTSKTFSVGHSSGTKKGNVQITSIEITFETVGGNPTVVTPQISGNNPFLTSTEVTITCGTDGAAIQYSVDNGTNWTDYSAPFTLNATTTVKAKATKSGMTDSSEASKTFTKVTPMTVEEALTVISGLGNNGTSDDQCVSGIVCTAGSLSDGAITYYISDDGTTTDRLQVYKGKGLYNDDFTAAGDIAIGDVVVVYGTLKNYNGNTPEFDQGSYLLSQVRQPVISTSVTELTGFTYVEGSGPSAAQTVSVSGLNLTANISLSLGENSNFEMCLEENGAYTNSLTLTQSEGTVSATNIYVRLKSGLSKAANYAGTITLISDATDKTVSLSGSVTGQTYAINLDDQVVGGTIEADFASAEEGATVTLTAHPNAAYTFGSWTVYQDDLSTEVTVTDNQFTMPACEVYVTATFNTKPTYDINCVASPGEGGEIEASPASAYEGQTVTLTYLAETGYSFSSIVITKTSDGSATGITPTASGDDFTFTMPAYPVTVTATFLSNIFEGSFAQVTATSALEDGGYYILYSIKAMNSTVTSGKMGATEVIINGNNIIENPDRSIVWKLVKNGDYWDLYSEKESKYCYIEGNNTSAFKMAAEASYHYVVTAYASGGGFKFKTTHTNGRGINYGSDNFGSYADSNSPIVYLYKYTSLTERTITFNGNGGTYNEVNTYTQDVYDGVEATLDANQFTRDGFEFVVWNNQADGNGATSYDDGDNITVTGDDLTLYAQWAPLYTLTIDNNIAGGSVSVVGNVTSAIEGTEITLSSSPTVGHAFSAWNVYKTGAPETTVTVTDNKFNMPAYNVTVSATFVEAITYSLITDASQIVSGKHYIIASGTDGSVKVMARQNENNRATVAVTAANNTIPETAGIYEFVINGLVINETNYFTIYDTNNASTGYLYASGGTSSNQLKTQATNNYKGQWSITINPESFVASITANFTGNNARNLMRYNSNNNIFSCYNSGQQSIYLFIKDGDTDFEYYGSELSYSEYEIPVGQTITVGTGSVMTVSNSLTNTNPANLIIEDGGQLITSSTGVQATVKKDIKGAGDENWAATSGADGWYFIASPVDNASFNTAIVDYYDLYLLDWANNYWRNLKNNENESLFANGFQRGTGYLYASKDGNTISVAGEIQPLSNDDNATVTLANDGWNLIGNPLTCKVTVDHSFGLLNNGSAIDYTGTTVNPFQGIVVWGNANEEVTFTKAATQNAAAPGNSSLQMTVAQNVVTRGNTTSTTIDNAVVSFNESSILPKFNMLEGNAKLYIPQGNEEYAIVSSNGQGEMPVNFKAAQNGTYTLSIEAENVEMDYLHLIDNMTGADVDLLQTPSYSFTSKTTDYASRFRLVFSANSVNDDSTSSETFAFINGEEIVITNAEADATLQVVDMTGRIMVNTKGVNRLSTAGMTPGVYVIRLVNGEKVKTQKIVVR